MKKEAEALSGKLIDWRRTIHRHPEPAFAEVQTAALVATALTRLGLTVKTGVGKTGVVADLVGQSDRTIALRADMDALPVQEPPGREYGSQVQGFMHACGHDAHVAMLLGAAELLASRKAALAGSVRFIFQPGEEGAGGAAAMLADGAFEGKRKPAAVFGIHCWPFLPAGTFAVRGGPVMAASDKFKIVLHGKGGHGAYPHLAKDSILAGSQIVSALQAIVAREVDPVESAVVSVNVFRAGTKENVIPAGGELLGTSRSFRVDVRELIERRVREIAEGIARSFGVEASVEYERGTPPVVNDAAFAAFVRQVGEETLGKEAAAEHPPSMGAEDFALFLGLAPGAFARIGVGTTGKPVCSLHSPEFDVDERALPLGAALHAAVALSWMARG
jgi:amidohydrolase